MSYSTDKPMAKLCPRGCMTDNLPSIIIRATTNSRGAEHSRLPGRVGKNSGWIKGLDGEDYWFGVKPIMDYVME